MVMAMKKRFKTKKSNKKGMILLFIIIAYISFRFIYSILFDKFINRYFDSSKLITYLVNNGLSQNNKEKELVDVIQVNLKEPIHLLNYGLSNVVTLSEDTPPDATLTTMIEDPNPKVIEEPIVYIYNSHQLENYNTSYLEAYNIRPNVMMASYILREKLNDLNIRTIVETNSVEAILTANAWNYAASYKASRILLEDAKATNPSLTYYIDLHRDSSKRDKTTLTIGEENYAKVLFVVGKEHDNYKQNLEFVTKMNNKLKEFNSDLSRGIYLKEGAGVNGIYNQDFSPNAILIELGGSENTIDEVANTIDVLAKIIYECVGE